MKTKSFLIILGLITCLIIWSCEEDQLTNTEQEAELELRGNSGKGKGGGKPDSKEEDAVSIFKVRFVGDVTYHNADSATISKNPLGTLLNLDSIYVYVERNNGKVTLLRPVECPDITSARVIGHSVLNNACTPDTMCGGIGIRQYDKKSDSRKVFSHFGVSGGRISMRGFIYGQSDQAGNETILPANVGESVLIAMDQIRVLYGPGSPCATDFIYFNNYNGNGYYDGGAVIADTIPDQSLLITKLDHETFDPCNIPISCGYPGF